MTEQGSLTCALDTANQGIDFIESAINSVIGTNEAALNNIDMALNICASELLDFVNFT